MNKFNLWLYFIVFTTISFISGCEEDAPIGLYDENKSFNIAPVINSINPPDSTYAGISEITIIIIGR